MLGQVLGTNGNVFCLKAERVLIYSELKSVKLLLDTDLTVLVVNTKYAGK